MYTRQFAFQEVKEVSKAFFGHIRFVSIRSINQVGLAPVNILQELQQFYLSTVLAIFIFAMILQIPRLNINSNIKLAVFVSWAIYGVLPTLHWTIAMGGFDNPIVRMLIPRVIGMYIINAIAFAFYMLKIPERFYPGNWAAISGLVIIMRFLRNEIIRQWYNCTLLSNICCYLRRFL